MVITSLIALKIDNTVAQSNTYPVLLAVLPEKNAQGLFAFIYCLLLGVFGVHRFVYGKKRSGVFMLFTLGGLGVWWLADLITILAGRFEDADGNILSPIF